MHGISIKYWLCKKNAWNQLNKAIFTSCLLYNQEGQFSELCDAASMNITNSTSDLQEVKFCSASQVALADCYIIGRLVQALGIRSLHSVTIINNISLHSTAVNLSFFLYGVIVDKLGPKASSGIGECLPVCFRE